MFKECLLFMVRLNAAMDFETVQDLVDLMRHSTLTEGLPEQGHLIVTTQKSGLQKETLIVNFQNSFCTDVTGFKQLLLERESKAAIIQKLNDCLFISANPFHYLGPCAPEMFVGCADLIQEILYCPQRAFAITGGRRIGKSSLLFKLMAEIKNNTNDRLNYTPIYMDCSNFANFQDLINELSSQLFPDAFYHKGPQYQWSLQKILTRLRGMQGKTLFLFLDEIDPLIVHEKQLPSTRQSAFNLLRAEVNRQNLRLVVAGFREVVEMINDYEHPFYNLCEGKQLSVLREQDVNELIALPLFKLDITLG